MAKKKKSLFRQKDKSKNLLAVLVAVIVAGAGGFTVLRSFAGDFETAYAQFSAVDGIDVGENVTIVVVPEGKSNTESVQVDQGDVFDANTDAGFYIESGDYEACYKIRKESNEAILTVNAIDLNGDTIQLASETINTEEEVTSEFIDHCFDIAVPSSVVIAQGRFASLHFTFQPIDAPGTIASVEIFSKGALSDELIALDNQNFYQDFASSGCAIEDFTYNDVNGVPHEAPVTRCPVVSGLDSRPNIERTFAGGKWSVCVVGAAIQDSQVEIIPSSKDATGSTGATTTAADPNTIAALDCSEIFVDDDRWREIGTELNVNSGEVVFSHIFYDKIQSDPTP